MSDKGYVKIDRQILEHWTWEEKPFSKGQAWIDLILLANYKDTKKLYKGEVITCERGTVNLSIQYLAERWGWNWKTTKAFLLALQKDNMIHLNVTRHRTTATLVNYDKIQNQGRTNWRTNGEQTGEPDGEPTGGQDGEPWENKLAITNKRNKGNKEKKSKKSKELEKYIDWEAVDTGWEPEGGWITPGEEDE